MGRPGGGGGGGHHRNAFRTTTMSNITMSNASDPIDFAFPLLRQLVNASSFAREGDPPLRYDYISLPLI